MQAKTVGAVHTHTHTHTHTHVSLEESNKIQILRGIAIVAVVAIHNTPSGLPSVFIRPLVNFAVSLFLFLSAYLSSIEKWNPKKRITKVLIPYVIWTIIYTVFYNYKNLSIIPKQIIFNLVTAKSAAIMYYIFVYIQFTLLIPLIDKIGKSKYKYLPFLIAPIESIFMRLFPMIKGITLNESINTIMNNSCLGWFTYFYLGYLLGNKIIKIKKSTKLYVIILIISIGLQITEGYIYYINNIPYIGSQFKLTTILTNSVFLILTYKFLNNGKKYNSKILTLLGDYSFGIYFSHVATMPILNKVVPYYNKIIFPINVIIVLVVSCILIFFGKKILGKYSKYFAL